MCKALWRLWKASQGVLLGLLSVILTIQIWSNPLQLQLWQAPFIALATMLFLALSWSFLNCGLSQARRDVRTRLNAYARLKPRVQPASARYRSHSASLLSAGAHEVLLGTLKKVEAKNASLATILVFVASIFANPVVVFTKHDGLSEFQGLFFKFALIPMGPLVAVLIAASVWGMRQIDNSAFYHLWDRRTFSGPITEKLQSDLIDDLIFKERLFKVCFISAIGVLLYLALAYVLLASADEDFLQLLTGR